MVSLLLSRQRINPELIWPQLPVRVTSWYCISWSVSRHLIPAKSAVPVGFGIWRAQRNKNGHKFFEQWSLPPSPWIWVGSIVLSGSHVERHPTKAPCTRVNHCRPSRSVQSQLTPQKDPSQGLAEQVDCSVKPCLNSWPTKSGETTKGIPFKPLNLGEVRYEGIDN